MALDNKPEHRKMPKILQNTLKATAKASIIIVVFLGVSKILTPFYAFIPDLQHIIESFVIVYIILQIMSDMTAGSILRHLFNNAKALFIIAYALASLGTGIFNMTLQGLSLVIDIRMFMVITMLLGLLVLAQSVLQTINYVNEKAEIE